jgi:hypothetical protein
MSSGDTVPFTLWPLQIAHNFAGATHKRQEKQDYKTEKDYNSGQRKNTH